MEIKLQQIKKNFNKLKDIRVQITNLLNIIEYKNNKLKTKTKNFIDSNKNNLFTFGLDSYQFQNKLIEYEYEDMKKIYHIFNNRMYCEYYKLYKIVSGFVEESMTINKNLELLKLGNVFPVYKDLEPLKLYSFEIIEDLHKTIILLLSDINDYVEERENELNELKKTQQSALHINNFLNTYEYNIISIRHKGLLYISYLEFFHIIHTKNFNRFANKMKTIDEYINVDIDIDIDDNDDVNIVVSDEKILPKNQEKIKANFNISRTTPSPTPTPEAKNMKGIFKSKAQKVMNGLKILKARNNNLVDSLIHNKSDSDNSSEISIHSFDTNESHKEVVYFQEEEQQKQNDMNIDKEHINKIFNELTNNCYEILNSTSHYEDDDLKNNVYPLAEPPVETPDETPDETPVENPVETPIENPIEPPVETPDE
jgi:hypothetical protein